MVGIELMVMDDDMGKVLVVDIGFVIIYKWLFYIIICIYLLKIIFFIIYENLYLR